MKKMICASAFYDLVAMCHRDPGDAFEADDTRAAEMIRRGLAAEEKAETEGPKKRAAAEAKAAPGKKKK